MSSNSKANAVQPKLVTYKNTKQSLISQFSVSITSGGDKTSRRFIINIFIKHCGLARVQVRHALAGHALSYATIDYNVQITCKNLT